MSRSGYTDDDDDQWATIRWRGAVASATRGARGQALLREALIALDAMPVKELAASSFQAEGQFCTLGVVGAARGTDLSALQHMAEMDDGSDVAVAAGKTFNISQALAAEIMYENDEAVADTKWVDVEFCGPVRPGYPDWGRRTNSIEVPVPHAAERRWRYMRDWVASQIQRPKPMA